MNERRFVALDSWRGICALLVAVHNFSLWVGMPLAAFVAHSWLFVDFFFVLSGFVITHAYVDRLATAREAGVFLLRRLGRLWPLHVAVLATWVSLSLLKFAGARLLYLPLDAHFGDPGMLRSVATNLLLVQAFDPSSWLTWNTPSWSISTELWTYLLFAVVCIASLNRRPSPLLMGGIALGAAVVLFLLSPSFLENSTDYAFLRCFYGFFSGHLVYRAWEALPRIRRGAGALEILALALVMGFVLTVGDNAFSMVAPLIFGFAVWIFAHEEGSLSALFKTWPLVRLGTWSYSIYMVHLPVIEVLLRAAAFVGKSVSGLINYLHLSYDLNLCALLIGYLIAVVALAATTYSWIEQPSRRSFYRLSERLL